MSRIVAILVLALVAVGCHFDSPVFTPDPNWPEPTFEARRPTARIPGR